MCKIAKCKNQHKGYKGMAGFDGFRQSFCMQETYLVETLDKYLLISIVSIETLPAQEMRTSLRGTHHLHHLHPVVEPGEHNGYPQFSTRYPTQTEKLFVSPRNHADKMHRLLFFIIQSTPKPWRYRVHGIVIYN